MFTPEFSLAALRGMREKYGEKIYGRYGFIDAFNPALGWYDHDVIGINVGIILLSAENARTGNVWRWFMRNVEVPRALQKIGLVKYDGHNQSTGKDLLKAFGVSNLRHGAEHVVTHSVT